MPIRVLHVVSSLDAGGIETMLMNIYRNIDRNKVQFDFLVHREYESFYEREVLALGGRIHRVPAIKLHGLPKYIRALKKFYKKNTEYKVVHSHISVMSYLVLKVAQSEGVRERYAHSHEYHESLKDHKIFRRPIIIFCKSFINRHVTHRFACSADAGRWLFGNRDDVKVLPNAIDAGRYRPGGVCLDRTFDDLTLSDRFLVGHIGNFSKAKNYPFILEVFSRLLEKKPDSMLVLVGKNESNPWVEERIKELGIQDSVVLTGVRSDIPDLLKAMDAFLFPSLHEGLPVTLVEAQASGIKCLVSDAVTEEVKITDNLEFMSLEKPADVWAGKLLEYADGYERQDTYQQIVDAGYDIQSNVRWLENFYLEAAERARQSA